MNAARYSPDQMQYFMQDIGAVHMRMMVEGRFYVAEIGGRPSGPTGWPAHRTRARNSQGKRSAGCRHPVQESYVFVGQVIQFESGFELGVHVAKTVEILFVI